MTIGLPEIAAGAMALSLNGYVLLGGADFGGGVWDLLARGPRRDAHRTLVADAIAPIWEANHVWLILVVVLCFTCFPPAFARLTTVLHVPLSLMLIGIVLRGSAFVFRAYDSRRDAVQRRWGRIFAATSLVTPVLLGISLGALVSGAVGTVNLRQPGFAARFVAPWATPFALAVGVMTLCLFAFLAATYLTVEAAHIHQDDALATDFRRRAIAAQLATIVAAWGVVLLEPDAGIVRAVVTGGSWAIVLQVLTAGCTFGALAALWGRHWRLARFAAQGEASCLVWGWAWAQFPAVIPPDGTVRALAAPHATLVLALGTLAAGTAILLPSFVYLFHVFKRTEPATAFEHVDG